jgi:hypothetical protein
VRHAINAKRNEPFRDFFLHYDYKTKENRPKIFSEMAIEINFRATREPGRKKGRGRKYFPALLNSHIFSPYFRVSKHSRYFFAPQRTFYELCARHIGPSVYPSNCTPIRQELARFPQQRN